MSKDLYSIHRRLRAGEPSRVARVAESAMTMHLMVAVVYSVADWHMAGTWILDPMVDHCSIHPLIRLQ